MLQVNPLFTHSFFIKQFCIHFKPTTINLTNHSFFNSKVFSVVECIKYPRFSVFIKSNTNEIRELIPKVKSFELFDNDEQTEFFIDNAQLFNDIQRIKGNLFQIIKFMKNFSNKGTLKNISYPKIIQSENISHSLSGDLIKKVNELKSYIPSLNETKIYLQFFSHMELSKKQLLSQLTDVHYSYCCFSDNNCCLFNDNYSLYKGTNVILNEVSYPNDYNELIEKTYCKNCVVLGVETMRKDSNIWIIPICIKTMSFYGACLIKNNCNNFINFDMKNLTFLLLSHSNNIEFCNEFKSLTRLKIKKCKNISFKQNKEKVFHYSLPCINCIEIINSKQVEVQLPGDTLKYLDIDQSTDIHIKGNVDNVNKLFISYSKNCTIPSKLLKSDEKTIENSEIILSDKNDIRRFILATSTVKVNNNSYSKSDKNPCDELMISNEFYNPNNKTKQLVYSNDKQIKVPASIHYFEVEIFGYAIIQIGLFNRPLEPFIVTDLDKVGCFNDSISYHSDDGNLYFNRNVKESYGPTYGKEYENSVIGCGFNIITNEVFFVHNGIKLGSTKVNWSNISAMISYDDFDDFTINYGQKQFVYDLEQAIRDTNENIK
ncbi:B30.2/SPRY domain-containing protein [Entamoeba marina]